MGGGRGLSARPGERSTTWRGECTGRSKQGGAPTNQAPTDRPHPEPTPPPTPDKSPHNAPRHVTIAKCQNAGHPRAGGRPSTRLLFPRPHPGPRHPFPGNPEPGTAPTQLPAPPPRALVQISVRHRQQRSRGVCFAQFRRRFRFGARDRGRGHSLAPGGRTASRLASTRSHHVELNSQASAARMARPTPTRST